jgi:hypothetical protein
MCRAGIEWPLQQTSESRETIPLKKKKTKQNKAVCYLQATIEDGAGEIQVTTCTFKISLYST